MPLRIDRRRHRFSSLLLLACATACGGKPAADPGNREIPWAYGPTNGTATAEHMRGTGKEGGAAIARGWQCRLQEGKRLAVVPYQLAESHPLFGKVALAVSLFDKNGKEIGAVLSPPLAAGKASFTFDVDEAAAKNLWDLVIWYRKV
jgi:hypothetical protein